MTPRSFAIDEVDLALPGLNADGEAISVALVADLHPRRDGEGLDALAAAIAERNVDLVALVGDFWAYHDETLSHVERFVRAATSRHGLFAARGNWELKAGPPLRTLRKMFADWGARLLVNEFATVETRAGRLNVAGLDDFVYGMPDFGTALPSPGCDTTILLAHEPLAVELLPEDHPVDLTLCGHTHGGQFRFPLVWKHFLPTFCGRMIDGLAHHNGSYAYVNRGFGVARKCPFRLRCPAELTVLRLSGSPPSASCPPSEPGGDGDRRS